MRPSSLLSFCLLLSCGTPSQDSDTEGPEVTADPSGAVPLTDDDNYAYTGLIDAPSYPTQPSIETVLDFSAVVEDMRCHDMAPADEVDNVALMIFPYLSEEEVEAGLADDSLEQVDLGGYVSWENEDGATQVSIDQLTFFGTDPELDRFYTEEEGATWLVLLTSGTQVGVGARALAFLEPTNGEETATVELQDACGILDFEADLVSAGEVPVLADGPWYLDWSAVGTDGRGNAINPSDVDGFMLAFYAGLSASDVQERFLDLELIADQMWEVDLAGEDALDLSTLDGFEGFDDTDGTWLVALRCSLCPNPAPLFLAVLDPQ